MQYALYRLLIQGFRRCLGLHAPPLTLAGYPRSFVYFSGRPQFMVHGGGFVESYPVGYERKYSSEYGAWYWTSGNNDVLWDTRALG